MSLSLAVLFLNTFSQFGWRSLRLLKKIFDLEVDFFVFLHKYILLSFANLFYEKRFRCMI